VAQALTLSEQGNLTEALLLLQHVLKATRGLLSDDHPGKDLFVVGGNQGHTVFSAYVAGQKRYEICFKGALLAGDSFGQTGDDPFQPV
jgi:hypothetical protein